MFLLLCFAVVGACSYGVYRAAASDVISGWVSLLLVAALTTALPALVVYKSSGEDPESVRKAGEVILVSIACYLGFFMYNASCSHMAEELDGKSTAGSRAGSGLWALFIAGFFVSMFGAIIVIGAIIPLDMMGAEGLLEDTWLTNVVVGLPILGGLLAYLEFIVSEPKDFAKKHR